MTGKVNATRTATKRAILAAKQINGDAELVIGKIIEKAQRGQEKQGHSHKNVPMRQIATIKKAEKQAKIANKVITCEKERVTFVDFIPRRSTKHLKYIKKETKGFSTKDAF